MIRTQIGRRGSRKNRTHKILELGRNRFNTSNIQGQIDETDRGLNPPLGLASGCHLTRSIAVKLCAKQ
jgi:hypothetical protein